MSLKNTLEQCIKRGQVMTMQIAKAQFGDSDPTSRTITRRFGIKEAAELAGVSEPTIRASEESGQLPPPDFIQAGSVQRREGYTIYQIDHMRDIFGTAPKRPVNSDPVVISVSVNKGGAYKTSSAVHIAQSYALQGFRTLIIDMDPQATASLYHGYVPELHITGENTVLPFMIGEKNDLSYAIKTTCWPKLDIIPSCLELHRIESEVYAQYDDNKLAYEPHLLLRAGIETIWKDYDIIIIDSAPTLGVGTVNLVCASDVIIVPTPAELYDYVSSYQFFTMLNDVLSNIDLGGFEPDVKVLVTKYSNSMGSQSEWMLDQIRASWNEMVLKEIVRTTDEVGKGQIRMRTIFEQAADQRSTSSAWRNAISIWEPVANEILNKLITPRWSN
ncbi:AAA family ATPase (plasmid) [Orbus sturtevantii]|uniref:AAA family ATPase n=1 Tax=Orbus sturtevantii TaxID=3074109 RepID=UPI00370D9B04